MPEEKTDKKKVFISYGHDKCQDLAFVLSDKLEKKGYDPWIDKSELKTGLTWGFEIEKGLKESESVLVLMTPHSMRRPSGFCLKEIAMADILGKRFIPIMVRDITPPLQIVNLQYLNFTQWPCSKKRLDNKIERKFESEFNLILDVVDGKKSFFGNYTILRNKLNPINFGAEISMHTENFSGRGWIFKRVKNWLYDKKKEESNIFLLIGKPGVGKTSIAAKICRDFGEVAAYYLIKYGYSSQPAKEYVKSLAYQLSNQIPEYAERLVGISAHLGEILKKNAKYIFKNLIVEQLYGLNEPEEPKLIVIDALDEATQGTENEMVDLITHAFKKLPKWLKIFITSRPEQGIQNRLDILNPYSLDISLEEDLNYGDIRGYLEKELILMSFITKELNFNPNLELENAVKIITERSEGVFLYIQLILEDLKHGELNIHEPEEFPKGLTGKYLEYFKRQFPNDENYKKYQRPLLELVVAAQEPLEISLIKEILNWDTYDEIDALDTLGSLFEITVDKKIKPFHTTLTDWLIEKDKTKAEGRNFFIDPKLGHEIFADYGWKLYKSEISRLPFYFFHHLPRHLMKSDRIEELTALKQSVKLEIENPTISEVASAFILHLTQYFKKKKRDDILAELLIYSKKVSCPGCGGLDITYRKSRNKYTCIICGLVFDTKIHAKFKNVFLSYSSDETFIDLIEQVKTDLEGDYHSITKTWEEAQVVIMFLSPNTVKNEECIIAINNARSNDKKIISILIEDCIPPKKLNLRRIIPLDFKYWPFTDLEYKTKLNQLKYKIEEEIIIADAFRLNNAYISFESGAKYNFINELDDALKMLGINTFINDGVNHSHELCIDSLKNSDLVIFFAFPQYGDLIKFCYLKDDCRAECPMKTGTGQISITHCEYKTTIAEGIYHKSYITEKSWETSDLSKEALQLRREISTEIYRRINNIEDPEILINVIDDLVLTLTAWYFAGRIDLPYFSGRREELETLLDSIDSKVEVSGVAGVGKTTLVQVALIFQILKRRKVISIGTLASYTSGSGYEPFRRNCRDFQYITESRNEITLYDIMNASTNLLPDVGNVRWKPKDELIPFISNLFNSENITLFIDDFHLADEDVVNLVKEMDNVIIASRKNTYLAKKEIYLGGIGDLDRENILDLMLTRSSKIIPNWVKDKILQISEGHPITMELLVRNYNNIDFDKLEKFNFKNIDDTLRLIQDIVSPKAFDLLKDLSVINTIIDTNINRECVESSYDMLNTSTLFDELVDAGMLTKKEGKEVEYEFVFKHIHIALKSSANQASHKNAAQYYKTKKEKIGKSVDDSVEILFHLFKSNPTEDVIYKYVKFAKKISLMEISFKRLVDIGKQIKDSFQTDEVFRDDHKATIVITLGNLYNKMERLEQAEIVYKEALDFIKDIDNLIGENIKNLLYIDNNSFFDLFDEFIGYYMVYVSTYKIIEPSPWKELRNRLSKIIEDSTNDEIRDKISLIFSFFVNMIGNKQKKLYFSEANKLVHILVAEKPKVDEISNACALYDQLRWMASIVKEDDKDLSLKTAELYEEYASVFDEVKKKKPIKEVEMMRPYTKILESAAWHYQLGEEYIKSAEKYIEIYGLEFDRLSLGQQKFMLWMAALNFSRGDELVQSTEHYINLAKLLVETQQISELAVDLYKKAISQLDESSEIYSEIKERYEKAKEKFDTQKKSCEESEINALLVSNIYDKIAADIVGSHLYLNNINCYFETNIKNIDELLKYNGEYDYILLHGGPLAPGTGYLVVEIFGKEKDFANLRQTTNSYQNVWTRNIKDTKTRWILIAGNGAEPTLEAIDMFKKGNYLK